MRARLAALLAALSLSTPSAAPATFKNPVISGDFPDPFIMAAGRTFYAYSTNNAASQNVPVQTSRDLIHWTPAGDAMPKLAAWTKPGLTWAPEVMRVGQHYRLYYTARDAASDKQCVGVASASSPAGPFVDTSPRALVCQAAQGGTIDASPFVNTDGRRYLLFKNDGNCCGLPTHLYLQPLSADGLQLTGKPTALLVNGAPWEGNVIEAPTLHRAGGVYYLLYSGGAYDSDGYATGYATARTITGPYTKFAGNPLVKTRGKVAGPGHQALVQDGAGQWWLAYHAWTAPLVGYPGGERSLRLDRIAFQNGRVVFGGVTDTPQRAPTPLP